MDPVDEQTWGASCLAHVSMQANGLHAHVPGGEIAAKLPRRTYDSIH